MSAFILRDRSIPGGYAWSGIHYSQVQTWCHQHLGMDPAELVEMLSCRFTTAQAVMRLTQSGLLLYRVRLWKGGQEVARFARRYDPARKNVHHTLLVVWPQFRNQGINRVIQQCSLVLYAAWGVRTITLEAGLQHGAIVWALHGFRLVGPNDYVALRRAIQNNYVAIAPRLQPHEFSIVNKVLSKPMLVLPYLLVSLPIHVQGQQIGEILLKNTSWNGIMELANRAQSSIYVRKIRLLP